MAAAAAAAAAALSVFPWSSIAPLPACSRPQSSCIKSRRSMRRASSTTKCFVWNPPTQTPGTCVVCAQLLVPWASTTSRKALRMCTAPSSCRHASRSTWTTLLHCTAKSRALTRPWRCARTPSASPSMRPPRPPKWPPNRPRKPPRPPSAAGCLLLHHNHHHVLLLLRRLWVTPSLSEAPRRLGAYATIKVTPRTPTRITTTMRIDTVAQQSRPRPVDLFHRTFTTSTCHRRRTLWCVRVVDAMQLQLSPQMSVGWFS